MMLKTQIWLRQKLMDSIGAIQNVLGRWNMALIDSQLAARKKLGIQEIQSYVVWGDPDEEDLRRMGIKRD